MSRAILTGLTIVALSMSGACEEVVVPSEYDEQRFLCDAGGTVLEADAASCRDAFRRDGSCRGIFSMRGTLGGQKLTLGTTFLTTEGKNLLDENGKLARDGFAATGQSPYFDFRFVIESLGGTPDMVDATPKQFRISEQLGSGEFADDAARVQFRLSAGAESENHRAGRGTLTVSYPAANEVSGAFSGDFGVEEEHLDGCFLAIEDLPQ